MTNLLTSLLSNAPSVKHTLLILLLSFTTSYVASAKSNAPIYYPNPVKGKITDSRGVPVVGANVIIKGTSTATSTDKEGNVELAATLGDILIVSYVGFKKIEVTATAGPLSISLEDAAAILFRCVRTIGMSINLVFQAHFIMPI